MKRLIFLIVLILHAMQFYGQEITRPEADQLLMSLKMKSLSTSQKIKVRLDLAGFFILGPGEDESDLARAKALINEASTIIRKAQVKEYNGYLLLLEAYLTKEKGHLEKARVLFNNAVDVLKLGTDRFHYAMACLELAKYYNSKDLVQLEKRMSLQQNALSLVATAGNQGQKSYALIELQVAYMYAGYGDNTWRMKFLKGMLKIMDQVHDRDFHFIKAVWATELRLRESNFSGGESQLRMLLEETKHLTYGDRYLLKHLADFLIKNDQYDKALYYQIRAYGREGLESYYSLFEFYRSQPDFIYSYLKLPRGAFIFEDDNVQKYRTSSANFVRDIALSYISHRKYRRAAMTLLDLIQTHKSLKDVGLCITLEHLAFSYYHIGDFKQTVKYALESIKMIKTKEDSTRLWQTYLHLSNAYLGLHMTEEAVTAVEKMIDVLIVQKKFEELHVAFRHMARLLIMQGKAQEGLRYLSAKEKEFPLTSLRAKKFMAQSFAQCYVALKQFDKAQRYYDLVSQISTSQIYSGELDVDPDSDFLLGVFYTETGRFKIARKYLERAHENNIETPTGNVIKTIHLCLFKIDSAAGNTIPAIKHLQSLQKLKDSTFNETKNRDIQELQIAYDTEQKVQDIRLLEEERKFQQARLMQTMQTRNWAFLGTGMLVLLLCITYNGYRIKKRGNLLLERQRREISKYNSELGALLNEKSNLILQKDDLINEKDHLIKEKEWLLKEVHHRVKNNLHTVICLLESQAVYLQDDALKAIEISQHRIYSMSLIHQKLYNSSDIKYIDMSVYISEFTAYLIESYGMENRIRMLMNISPLKFGIVYAIPVALIINEAVTNAMKHAFNSQATGHIMIRLDEYCRQVCLVIADSGSGIDLECATSTSPTLGIKLMYGLSEDIGGVLRFENDHGTKVTLSFNRNELEE